MISKMILRAAWAILIPLTGVMRTVAAEEPSRSTIIAPASEDNPRNSEGDMLDLPGGDLLLAWTEFHAGASDHADATIAARISGDNGATWGEKFTLQENIAEQNVMSVSFLRRENPADGEHESLFFFLRKNSNSDLTLWLRRLRAYEPGAPPVWGEPEPVPVTPGYNVMNNDRVIEGRKGRIFAPVAWTDDIGKNYNTQQIHVHFSDDGGRSWSRNLNEIVMRDAAGEVSPAMEPGLVELRAGRVMMIIRTKLGFIYRSYSADGGKNWTPPEPTELVSPAAPASVEPLPDSGGLLLIWNNVPAGARAKWGERNPLTAAVSRDWGATWTGLRDLETEPGASFAYTSIHFSGGDALLTYYRHTEDPRRLDLKLRTIPVGWFGAAAESP